MIKRQESLKNVYQAMNTAVKEADDKDIYSTLNTLYTLIENNQIDLSSEISDLEGLAKTAEKFVDKVASLPGSQGQAYGMARAIQSYVMMADQLKGTSWYNGIMGDADLPALEFVDDKEPIIIPYKTGAGHTGKAVYKSE